MTSPKREFKKVENLIHKLSWKVQKTTGLPFGDIRSEAYQAFMKACESYVPGSSKFSSWCYLKISCHLKHWLRERAKKHDRLIYVEEIKDEMLPVDTTPLRNSLVEQLSDLSPEAKKLIDIIIAKAGPEPQSPSQLLREACTEYRFECGADELETKIVVHEIRSELAAKIKP